VIEAGNNHDLKKRTASILSCDSAHEGDVLWNRVRRREVFRPDTITLLTLSSVSPQFLKSNSGSAAFIACASTRSEGAVQWTTRFGAMPLRGSSFFERDLGKLCLYGLLAKIKTTVTHGIIIEEERLYVINVIHTIVIALPRPHVARLLTHIDNFFDNRR
jgi:hypothetical protein